MPYKLKFENDGTGVVAIWSGTVTAGDMVAMNETIYSKEHLPFLRYQLMDFSRADCIKANPSDVHKVASQDREASIQNPNMLNAIVGSESFFDGWESFYKIYADFLAGAFGFQSNVFQDIEAARTWIDNTLR